MRQLGWSLVMVLILSAVVSCGTATTDDTPDGVDEDTTELPDTIAAPDVTTPPAPDTGGEDAPPPLPDVIVDPPPGDVVAPDATDPDTLGPPPEDVEPGSDADVVADTTPAPDTTPDVEDDVPTVPPGQLPSFDDFPAPLFTASVTTVRAVTINGFRTDVDLHLPQGAEGPLPVVVINHGFQLSKNDFLPFGERLAQYGFIGVLANFDNNAFRPRNHSTLADDVVALITWIIAENERAGSPLQGRVDAGRIGAGGHSRGGKQAILAATRDPRIRASFNMDPVDSNPPIGGGAVSVTPEEMPRFTIPGVFVGTGKGAQGLQACAPPADNYDQYYRNSPGSSWRILIPNAGHNDFVTSCQQAGFSLACSACPRGDEPLWNARYTAYAMVAFYRTFLVGDASYRTWLDGPRAQAMAPWIEISTRLLPEHR